MLCCRISVTFIDRDGTEFSVQASVGEDMLSVAHRKDIDLEGACEGSLACSTCHVVIDEQEMFDKIPEADDDENDMLDLAFGLTETCVVYAIMMVQNLDFPMCAQDTLRVHALD